MSNCPKLGSTLLLFSLICACGNSDRVRLTVMPGSQIPRKSSAVNLLDKMTQFLPTPMVSATPIATGWCNQHEVTAGIRPDPAVFGIHPYQAQRVAMNTNLPGWTSLFNSTVNEPSSESDIISALADLTNYGVNFSSPIQFDVARGSQVEIAFAGNLQLGGIDPHGLCSVNTGITTNEWSQASMSGKVSIVANQNASVNLDVLVSRKILHISQPGGTSWSSAELVSDDARKAMLAVIIKTPPVAQMINVGGIFAAVNLDGLGQIESSSGFPLFLSSTPVQNVADSAVPIQPGGNGSLQAVDLPSALVGGGLGSPPTIAYSLPRLFPMILQAMGDTGGTAITCFVYVSENSSYLHDYQDTAPSGGEPFHTLEIPTSAWNCQ